MCPGSRNVFFLLYFVLREFAPRLPLAMVISGDLEMEEDKAFAVVWILALSTEFYWDCKRNHSAPLQSSLHGSVLAELEILSRVSKLNKFHNSLHSVVTHALQEINS